MEFTLLIILILITAATLCEFIDSSMGMLYGTILSPTLIIAGFNPLIVVPSVLISQALGGLIASIYHHRFKNVSFGLKIRRPKIVIEEVKKTGLFKAIRKGVSRDLRTAICIGILGIAATVLSVLVAVSIPKIALKTYIGVLVLAMGILLLSRLRFRYTWKKIFGVGVLSAFNKGLSGGGFGPVTTSGQMIAGRDGKASIGATTLAEVPICIVGFLTYLLTKGLADWNLPVFLIIGSIIGAAIGPRFTTRFKNDKKLRKSLGILVIVLGIWTLTKTWFL